MTVRHIPIELLNKHPDNPRLFLREDIISSIAHQIKESGTFDEAHALLVRPLDDHYQIIQGHHRFEAAKQVDFETLPCWIRDMSDDEAYMQLALGNVQGELSPLEIGIHALGVEFDKRGRGAEGGGLKGYAKNIGKNTGDITTYRQGATVLNSINLNIQINRDLLDKVSHLAAIHKAPQELWPMLVEWTITPNGKDKTPSANQTQEVVKALNKFEIPEEYKPAYPLTRLVESYLNSKSPTPDEIGKLINLARSTEAIIRGNAKKFNYELFPYTVDEFRQWLTEGVGTYNWQENEIDCYQQSVVMAAQTANKPPKPNVQLGEWYKLGEHLLYCGDTSKSEFYSQLPEASFAFADPPYNAGVDNWDKEFNWEHDWLIWQAPIVAVTPGIESIANFFKSQTEMPYTWSIAIWVKNGMTRGKLGFGNWIYTAIFSNESIYKQSQDIIEVTINTSNTKDSEHKGRKPPEMMQKLIEVFTEVGDMIIDPFLGSGTTLFEADKLGRICIGGEINPDFCNKIIERWQETTGQSAERE